MRSLIVMCVFCFCSFSSTFAQAMTVHFTFLPIDSDEVIYYRIRYVEISPSPDPGINQIIELQPTDLTARIYVYVPDLVEDTQYLFSVAACDINDVCGQSSDPITFPYPANAPKRVDGFQIEVYKN